MRRSTRLIAGAAAALLWAGAAGGADAPARIVTAGGDLTEIVVALGAQDRIVGVDSTSIWPPSVTALAQVGYVRRLSAEGVLSLTPDLVLAADDAGPAPALDLLRSAGVAIAVAPETKVVEDVSDKIRFVGEALDERDAAEALVSEFESGLSAARSKVEDVLADGAPRRRVLFILSTLGGAPVVGGTGTSADVLITEAGGINAAGAIEGYKPMNAEALIEAAPDLILMTQAHSDRLGGLEDVMARPDVSLTPAGQAGRGATMDALLLLGMGPRTPEAIATLAAKIHDPGGRR